MRQLIRFVFFLVVLAIPASADEFSTLVKNLQSHPGIRRTDSQPVGLAGMMANPAMWGTDAAQIKIAAFENESASFKPTLQELDQILAASVGASWQPILQLGSRKDGKATAIYTDATGKNLLLLIGSIEGNSIGVAQMELDEKAVAHALTGFTAVTKASATRH